MHIAILIVTYNSADDVPGCFAALAALNEKPAEVVVVDCASSDESLRVARAAPLSDGIVRRVVPLDENRGFAGGMNEALRHTNAPWVLTLNADAHPRPDFLDQLRQRIDTSATLNSDLRVGAITPRLLRPETSDGTRHLDACGMVLRKAWRHLDRASDEVDVGQHNEAALVFGGTGAATLWNRVALEDVAFADGAAFDPLFHSFREDAELCFRLQERGWAVVYEPAAVAEHRRSVLPKRRRQLPPFVNYQGLKNRYLLRAYHQTGRNFLRTFFPTLVRDLGALIYVLFLERTSLPAYAWLWRHRREIVQRRRYIQRRRTVSAQDVEQWFEVEEKTF